MQGNKVNILHCKCGLMYMSNANDSCSTIHCPICRRTPNEIEHFPQNSGNFKQRLSSILQKCLVPNKLIIFSIIGIAIIAPKILPQQAQLPSGSDLSKFPVEQNPSRSLNYIPNGTNIVPPQNLQGYGSLTVDNGTYRDAVIKLVDRNSGEMLRFVYVRSKHQVTMGNLPPCTCTFKFSTGTDWDEQTNKFLQNASFSEFIQPLYFRVIQTKEGEKWRTYKVTLHPVVAGNAQTQQIREKDF